MMRDIHPTSRLGRFGEMKQAVKSLLILKGGLTRSLKSCLLCHGTEAGIGLGIVLGRQVRLGGLERSGGQTAPSCITVGAIGRDILLSGFPSSAEDIIQVQTSLRTQEFTALGQEVLLLRCLQMVQGKPQQEDIKAAGFEVS